MQIIQVNFCVLWLTFPGPWWIEKLSAVYLTRHYILIMATKSHSLSNWVFEVTAYRLWVLCVYESYMFAYIADTDLHFVFWLVINKIINKSYYFHIHKSAHVFTVVKYRSRSDWIKFMENYPGHQDVLLQPTDT